MHVCMHIGVAWSEVFLHQLLVLLGIAASGGVVEGRKVNIHKGRMAQMFGLVIIIVLMVTMRMLVVLMIVRRTTTTTI